MSNQRKFLWGGPPCPPSFVFLLCYVLLLLAVFDAAAQSALRVTELPSPSGTRSQTPYLSAVSDRVYISWLQTDAGDATSFRVSSWDGKKWANSSVVASGVPFFVNWADFPSIIPLESGRLAAHWLQKTGKGSYAYNVQISTSADGGKTWGKPLKPHDDTVENEHGFVSIVPQKNGAMLSVWLDARKFKSDVEHAPGNEMQVMSRVYQNNKFEAETIVDPRACDCCQTTAVAVPDGVLLAYRDRSADEIRDISYSRYTGGKWTKPQTLHADGWKIAGCPVNGPAAAAMGNQVAIAWFTAAQEKPRVQVIFSTDGGKTFGKPVRVDGGKPTGRVDVEFIADGTALVSWLENTEGKGADIRIRKVSSNGKMDAPFTVAPSASARASGFPRMARWQKGVLLAWTDILGEQSKIRVVHIQ